MVSASEKLANVLLREKRSKMARKAKTSTYRKAYRQGARKALNYGGIDNAGILERFGRTSAVATAIQKAERAKLPYYGRGMYTGRGGFWGDAWNAAKSGWQATQGAREMLGGAARSGTFGATGIALGNVSKMLGTGAYVTNDLINAGGGAPDGVPSFGAPSDQGTMLSNSEYVSDIFGPGVNGAFENNVFELNPGLFKTFPWLSQVAGNYEEYELKQLIFTFKPTITDFVSTNGQVGTLVMATQYNVEDQPFTNKQDMMHYAGSMATKVSQGMLHGVECDPAKNAGAPGKFIRAGAVLPAQDKSNFDLGTLNVAVVNTPAEFTNKALGELWVSYTLVLRKPKFYAAEGSTIVQDYHLALPKTRNTATNLVPSAWDIYPALQNRIDGSLALLPSGNGIKFTLPATLQGTFKIICKFYTNIVSAGSGLYQIILDNPASMFPVKDMMSRTATGPLEENSWDWFTVSGAQTLGVETPCVTIEADIRLETPPSVGSILDNSFQIYSSLVPSAYTGIEIRVVNYNNYFDYNGTGQVILLDPTTDQVVAPVTRVN